jgi:hypothetical protein
VLRPNTTAIYDIANADVVSDAPEPFFSLEIEVGLTGHDVPGLP